jgi:hypothetical protein
MLKTFTAATLIAVATVGAAAPAQAKVCRNSHGKVFKCHGVLAPRINLKAKHPVKVVRCRGTVGKFNRHC